ncbi:MAG: PaaI family thioesterase [Pseudomonadota bacterium]
MARADVPEALDEWNARCQALMAGHLGLDFSETGTERVRARFEIRNALKAWNGFLNARAVVTLAETCCGHGTVVSLPDGADGFTPRGSVHQFCRHGAGGRRVACTAHPTHHGRSTQIWDPVVSAEATGRKMAYFRCTQIIPWPRWPGTRRRARRLRSIAPVPACGQWRRVRPLAQGARIGAEFRRRRG